tara:strand:+ start:246 stop:572 length:327 start_codon:yes stop_codon:yes gene_type:complete
MKDNYSNIKTPTTNQSWKDTSEEDRINLVHDELKKNSLYQNFEVTKAPSNGQIVLKIEEIIPANKRGLLLLELEKILKSSIDEGITVWCEPVGDKSKLRNLRGVRIKT